MPPRAFYNTAYRVARMPWETGPRQELVALVRAGGLRPGRALDLGCGTGANSVFLGQHGFDVTGVDFAPAALAKAARAAEAAGVKIDLVEDDLTALRRVSGPFDVLVDYGTLDDLSASDRDRYVRNVVPLARPGTRFLLWCFQWPPRRLDRWLGFMPMAPGEVARRFGNEFTIEQLGGTERPAMRRFIPGYAAYLMTRHAHKEDQDS
jgi:cyclopropane fatty-acyl-phospholipid synthase-like methyltransferase